MAKKPVVKKSLKHQLPPNVKVKEFHIDLSPRKWISPLILLFLVISITYNYLSDTGNTKYNHDIGLNTIQSNYASGIYQEIIIA